MKKKVVTFAAHDLDENYIGLANAICIQAVRDYEYLLSDKPLPSGVTEKYCNIQEIELFAKRQSYTDVNMEDILHIIKRNYNERFRPFVSDKVGDILRDWPRVKRTRSYYHGIKNPDKFLKVYPYPCPNCGGFLYQGSKKQAAENYIMCSGCNLNMLIPERYRKKEKKKCTISA